MIASPDGADGSVIVRQDVQIHACHLKYGEQVVFDVRKDRMAWIQVAQGTLSINGGVLYQGDALHTGATGLLSFEAGEQSEILIFDFASAA